MADHTSFSRNVHYAGDALDRAFDVLQAISDEQVRDLSPAEQVAHAQAYATVGVGYARLALATRPDEPEQPSQSAGPRVVF